VHARAAANLRLIRSFWHEFSFKNRLSVRAGLYQPQFRAVKQGLVERQETV
jgi:hypothetical protein